ncbi:MAG: hypothetical protein KAT15_12510, partial [Bacteroidales bacterium]|nr:hypothetical protein [Bacteroidales bacterium]
APPGIEPTIRSEDTARFPLLFQATRIVSRSSDAGHWWPWTRELEPEDAVQIHPEVARALGIENGDAVLVAGIDETWEGRAWISRMVSKWMVWSPRRFRETRVLVYKPGHTREQSRDALKEILQ